ncbi:MAG: cell division protein FtsA, partial [Bacteroidaceae bacterium]|nr:cell division protein FtsA [Bacteroidaceae bacterium]
MKEKEFIVAIELGSSAIRGIAGRRNPDGSVQVEHIAHVTSEDCIHRGVVYNIDKTTNAIRRVREMLEQALQLKVVKAYVGVQGQSLRTIKNFVRETFERVREVTDTDVDNLLDRNYSTNYGDLEILDVITQEYKLDHKEDDDPKGVET